MSCGDSGSGGQGVHHDQYDGTALRTAVIPSGGRMKMHCIWVSPCFPSVSRERIFRSLHFLPSWCVTWSSWFPPALDPKISPTARKRADQPVRTGIQCSGPRQGKPLLETDGRRALRGTFEAPKSWPVTVPQTRQGCDPCFWPVLGSEIALSVWGACRRNRGSRMWINMGQDP